MNKTDTDSQNPLDAVLDSLVNRAVERLQGDGKLISGKKLAERLGVEERTVKTLRDQGMPTVRVSRKQLLYSIPECEAWLRSQAA